MPGRTRSCRGQERTWSPPGCSRRQFLSPAPGALTAWEQEAERRTRLCSPATSRQHKKETGSDLFGASEAQWPHPRGNGPADVLSYQQKGYSPSFGKEWVRTFPLTLPELRRSGSPLVDRLRQEREGKDFPLQNCRDLGRENSPGWLTFPPGAPGRMAPSVTYDGLLTRLAGKRQDDEWGFR